MLLGILESKRVESFRDFGRSTFLLGIVVVIVCSFFASLREISWSGLLRQSSRALFRSGILRQSSRSRALFRLGLFDSLREPSFGRVSSSVVASPFGWVSFASLREPSRSVEPLRQSKQALSFDPFSSPVSLRTFLFE